jgi:hypothetical protein
MDREHQAAVAERHDGQQQDEVQRLKPIGRRQPVERQPAPGHGVRGDAQVIERVVGIDVVGNQRTVVG